MSKEILNRNIPEVIERAGNVKDLFLDPCQPVYRQKEQLQDTLRAIWSISSLYYPNDRLGKTDLIPVPLDRLIEINRIIELYLMSTKTVRKIETGKLLLPHEGEIHENTASLERTRGKTGDYEFLVSENYVVINGIHPMP